MSMSTHVVGFKPPDYKWKAMKEAYEACKKAGIAVPEEVQKFFNYTAPDPAGVTIPEGELQKCGAIREWSEDMKDGYEIFVAKLPADVQVVRVYNSY